MAYQVLGAFIASGSTTEYPRDCSCYDGYEYAEPASICGRDAEYEKYCPDQNNWRNDTYLIVNGPESFQKVNEDRVIAAIDALMVLGNDQAAWDLGQAIVPPELLAQVGRAAVNFLILFPTARWRYVVFNPGGGVPRIGIGTRYRWESQPTNTGSQEYREARGSVLSLSRGGDIVLKDPSWAGWQKRAVGLINGVPTSEPAVRVKARPVPKSIFSVDHGVVILSPWAQQFLDHFAPLDSVAKSLMAKGTMVASAAQKREVARQLFDKARMLVRLAKRRATLVPAPEKGSSTIVVAGVVVGALLLGAAGWYYYRGGWR